APHRSCHGHRHAFFLTSCQTACRLLMADPDRIARENLQEDMHDQARQNLRASTRRGKWRTTILPPRGDPWVIFVWLIPSFVQCRTGASDRCTRSCPLFRTPIARPGGLLSI